MRLSESRRISRVDCTCGRPWTDPQIDPGPLIDALKKDDVCENTMARYDALVNASYITSDLKERRNMRLAFQKSGFYLGGIKASLMTVTLTGPTGTETRKPLTTPTNAGVRRSVAAAAVMAARSS